MDRRSNKSWVGIVIGALFLSIGLAVAYSSAGKMITGYLSSGGWVEVPATIHSVKLNVKYGDASTYSVSSTYSYQYNGVTYNNDRVSLSTGSDNIGQYWESLEYNLSQAKNSNEAVAFVNPKDPTYSLLDRTFRWKKMVFGFVFFFIFGGVGIFLIWASMRGTKTKDARLQDEKTSGISSEQKSSAWFLAAFGGVFFVMGIGISLVALPDALRDGEYAALLILLFVIVGIGVMYYAFKQNRAYKRFGPTPLFLDPTSPGVGGQLGGRFDLNIPGFGHTVSSQTLMHARLTCFRVRKSKNDTHRSLKWHEEVPVYFKETVEGLEASFLFDIPESCTPTEGYHKGRSIEWKLSVEGEFGDLDLGKFERSWGVVVEQKGFQASRALRIPESFILMAQEKTQQRAKASALSQVLVSENAQSVIVHSKANRGVWSRVIGMLFGAIFFAVGVFTVLENWWPGYLFALIGAIVLLASLHALGKSIMVTIDKNTKELLARESWFGLNYSNKKGEVLDADQFNVMRTSRTTSHNKIIEQYALNFKSNGKEIRIADGINGKEEALALLDALESRLWP